MGRSGRFAASQTLWGAGGVLASLPGAHYVNHPWDNRAAEHKPAQLATAQHFGLLVPDTVITNSAEAAKEFVTLHPAGAVYKPLWNTPYSMNGEPRAVRVRQVHAGEITAAVETCPHMFQAKVEKAFDARVTAVGDQLFGVRIDSPELDWRHRQDLMNCTLVEVPESVAQAVAASLRHFRLTFGAFDFAVTAAGVWYFLECNPNGQWAWQPSEITDRIAHAIADRLEKGSAA